MPPKNKGLLEHSDELRAKHDVMGNYQLLKNAYDGGEKSPELLWRLGRAYYDYAQETTDKKEKGKLIEIGLEHASKSLEQLPNSGKSNLWYGILLSAKGDFVPTKDKIANAFIIRKQFEKAGELDATDCTPYHCLGNWCYQVNQITWIERQAASLLFGTPPQCSLEEAEKYCLASAQRDKMQIHNNLLLGDVLYKQKKYADAKAWYERAMDCPVETEYAKRQFLEAQEKAAKLK